MDYKGHMGNITRVLRRVEQIVAQGPSPQGADEALQLLAQTKENVEGATNFVATGSNGHISASALGSALKVIESLVAQWKK
ncbi:MAG: hypothetical protein AB1405_09190 [Bdellovibrionota bacterium]